MALSSEVKDAMDELFKNVVTPVLASVGTIARGRMVFRRRDRALTLAVQRTGQTGHTAEEIVQMAKIFETYLSQPEAEGG
jgi:hypothetical protein